jgi:hypothetical protein
MERLMKLKTESLVTEFVGKIGFYGDVLIYMFENIQVSIVPIAPLESYT